MKTENYSIKLGEKEINVQIGGFADQASGHCVVSTGETTILATAQVGQDLPSQGFFPLTCDYEEKFYAAGKILGSRFVRREGRPSVVAILTSRMIDRALRPVFPEGLTREIQCITTCLSWDTENDPAVLGLLGTSIALSISDIPFNGPVAGIRVAKNESGYILNPTSLEREGALLDIVFAGVGKGGDFLINMIEGRANEAKEVDFAGAFEFAQKHLKALLEFQEKIIKKHQKEKFVPLKRPTTPLLEEKVLNVLKEKLEKALYQKDRLQSKKDVKAVEEEVLKIVKAEFGEEYLETAKDIFSNFKDNLLTDNILKHEKRPDQRKLDEIREIEAQVALLPRTHGSALFQRGETKILSILTLGSPGDQQLFDEMEFSGKKRFLHHYNFPPYSVGEVKRLSGPGRREIGHGMLAEKALLPLLPSFDDFPYTIRIVSEALSSNGSTSMASVCAGALALMDAGVPLKRPVAGISVGIIKKDNDYKLITDIQGPEDSSGDMDFKVAGTKEGVTAIQMDVKIDGITGKIFREALTRAKEGREFILEKISKVLQEPRKELSVYAPKIYKIQINPDKIGAVIGSGGKVINEIIEKCSVEIDIEEDGRVFVSAKDDESAQKALDWIKGLTKEYEVGELVLATVVKITDFGAFMELSPGQDGLLHISEIAPFRVNQTSDYLKLGDKIEVKVIAIDEQGKISLSAKQAGFLKGQQPKQEPPRFKRR
ncbi:polyribonucleotide nucleotidyltransferase [bacterium (Candidatus Gribaldobacteria) CG10_big_fil_rev_8_21_14_0_10_37_21]|uniref:Polyribonucleotide nucleotidyltransferase n=1 Tax=bacterium (Candidatus Gribaldobacteria) CG10_big_fil_rev_8_21_14_0_10_37_21 TaxID=2014275 RepID=A0A2H0UTX2_9BACT|nr:MAG: polyribonucleotide nucleotidyltransferase [Parcubacteria group bacterium CG1_02_37_13]PIR90192.1 MAG: polyribonucleotide nucleotidyltransferase [bacterium (Candidatus Gribaldobacteria) CG10_big_fil_rev_8_21_14_0_10_37_21]